jgi:hypothetical protein
MMTKCVKCHDQEAQFCYSCQGALIAKNQRLQQRIAVQEKAIEAWQRVMAYDAAWEAEKPNFPWADYRRDLDQARELTQAALDAAGEE